jgi:hypothetical protein
MGSVRSEIPFFPLDSEPFLEYDFGFVEFSSKLTSAKLWKHRINFCLAGGDHEDFLKTT